MSFIQVIAWGIYGIVSLAIVVFVIGMLINVLLDD